MDPSLLDAESQVQSQLRRQLQQRQWWRRLRPRRITREDVKKIGHMILPSSMLPSILKASIALFISSILIFIRPTESFIGPLPGLLIFTITIAQPARPVGAQLELTILNTLAIIVMCGVVIGARAIAAAVNAAQTGRGEAPTYGRWVCMTFLMLGIFCASWVRAHFPRLAPAAMTSFNILTFGLTRRLHETVLHTDILSEIAIPIAIGTAITQVVNACVFPTSYHADTCKAAIVVLQRMQHQLKLISAAFRESIDVDSSVEREERSIHMVNDLYYKMRENTAELHLAATREAQSVAISRHPPKDYIKLSSLLSTIRHHMDIMVLGLRRLYYLRDREQRGEFPPPEQKVRSYMASDALEEEEPLSRKDPRYKYLGVEFITFNAYAFNSHARKKTAENDLETIGEMTTMIIDAFQALADVCITIFKHAEMSVQNDNIPFISSMLKMSIKRLYRFMKRDHLSDSEEQDQIRAYLEKQRLLAERLTEAMARYSMAEIRCSGLLYRKVCQKGWHDHAFFIFTIIPSLRHLALHVNTLLQLCNFLYPSIDASGRVVHAPFWRLWVPKSIYEWFSTDHSKMAGIFIQRDPAEYAAQIRLRRHAPDERASDRPQTVNGGLEAAIRDSQVEEMEEEVATDERTHLFRSKTVDRHKARISVFEFLEKLLGRQRESLYRKKIRRHYDHAVSLITSLSTKFAFKNTLIAFILALPAYVTTESGNFYTLVNGSWGLLSAIFMSNVAMGATVNFGVFRLLGTIFGGIVTIIAISLDAEEPNPYLLCTIIMIHGVFCFRTLYSGHTYRFGAVALIVSASIIVSVYTRSYDKTRAYHQSLYRVTTIIIALVLTIVINAMLWPFSARKELQKLIGTIIVELRVIYRNVRIFYLMGEYDPHFNAMLKKIDRLGIRLNRDLEQAAELLDIARRTIYLKNRFPASAYDHVLDDLYEMCTWIIAIRVAAILIDPELVRHLHQHVIEEQIQFDSVVILNLHALSGVMSARIALPAVLPSSFYIRKQMMMKLCNLISVEDTLRSSGMRIASSASAPPEMDTERYLAKGREFTYWYITAAALSGVTRCQERLVGHIRWLVDLDEAVTYEPAEDRTVFEVQTKSDNSHSRQRH